MKILNPFHDSSVDNLDMNETIKRKKFVYATYNRQKILHFYTLPVKWKCETNGIPTLIFVN